MSGKPTLRTGGGFLVVGVAGPALTAEERTLLAQYNLSRLIDRLEREGLVKRETFDQDGRGRWVVITEKGRSVRAAMWDVYGRSIQAHVGERLGEDEAATLAALLSRLT